MSEKKMMMAVLKAVIASAEMTDSGYLKGFLSFKENNDDSLELTITYFGETVCYPPEIYVKLPWLERPIYRKVRNDSDFDDLLLAIGEECNRTKSRVHKWYFHRNLPEICAMLHINVD